MKKIVIIKESDFITIIKTLLNESEVKKKKTIIAILTYLNKRFKGNKISKEEYKNILDRLNFKDYSNSDKLFNFYNEYSDKPNEWINHVDEMINYKTAFIEFVNKKIDKKDINIEADSNYEDLSIGDNSYDREASIEFKYLGEIYHTSINFTIGFEYIYDSGDYDTPEYESYDNEWVTINDDEIIIFNEDGDEFYLHLSDDLKNKLEKMLLLKYSP